jgi:serine protease
MFSIIRSAFQAVVFFFKTLFLRGQALRAIQFVIMVCTILLAFLSALEPIIRNPLVPPPENPDKNPGLMVVDMVDNPSDTQIRILEETLGGIFQFTHPTTADEGIGTIWVSNMYAAQHAAYHLDFIEVAEPQLQYTTYGYALDWPTNPPNDPMYSKQWNMEYIGTPYAWANSPQGHGVIVAVIDTGVTKVADLANTNILPGESFVPGERQRDGNGHGTHVAGTIAQSTNNGLGVVGIAPRTTILPVKVLSDRGSGSHDWIAAGIYYAVDEGASVINMSLGGPPGDVVEKAVEYARSNNVLVVCACGNSNLPTCGFPAGYADSIGVSSIGPSGERAPYSSYGKGVDIAAPGGDKNTPNGGILQHTTDGSKEFYGEFQGTSMAAPHVAGAAAVLFSMGLDTNAVEETLLRTADGNEWTDEFGNGILDLEAAVRDQSSFLIPTGVRPLATASLIALALAFLAGTAGRFSSQLIVSAALTAGGLFVLQFIPLDFWLLDMISRPLLEWPDAFWGPGSSGFPLWASAIPISVLGWTVGVNHQLRAPIAGIALGLSVSMLFAGVTGSVTIWFLPGFTSAIWLYINALGAGLVAMSIVGVQHLEDEHNK